MSGPLYLADAEGSIHRVDMDGLSVLFHRASGMTHIVAPPAPEILEVLAAGPCDVETLVQRMRARYDLDEESDDPRDLLTARLGELAAAGLVRRA